MDKILDKNQIDVVIYHHPCVDGFGSAFVVWYYHKSSGRDIRYVPQSYGKVDLKLEEYRDKNILMCDFSYSYEELAKLIDVSRSFLILDHHKTAQADLKLVPAHLKVFDMTQSGVGLTWNYFFPDSPLPTFLAYIQDRDLWTYKLEHTLEFGTYFNELEYDFKLWETFLDDDKVSDAIKTGHAWLEYQKLLIGKVVSHTSYIIQEINHRYVIVLYNNSSNLKSDIADEMIMKYPFGDFSAVSSYDLYNDETTYSLRSGRDNSRSDVSVIAKSLGGGGHRNAAGLVVKGVSGCLPFERIDDLGFFTMLLNAKKVPIKLGNKEYIFTLFQVDKMIKMWFEDKFLDLIKRKTQDTSFIIFEAPSEKIKYKNNQIIPLKDFYLFHNEHAISIPDQKLLFMTCGNTNNVLIFTTEKGIGDIFSKN